MMSICFFFNVTATTEIYTYCHTLSLHDALPISDVVSAHRMPEEMLAYGREAAERGLSVIVAGAGGAAHLPGMLAAVTPLPVIGVPVDRKSTRLNSSH